MNTLDDLLEVVPGMRKLRSLNADWLRKLLDRQKGQCTWCGKSVPKGRRTWCSQECADTFNLRCSCSHQMRHVIKRDNGICQLCGADTFENERKFKEVWKTERNRYPLVSTHRHHEKYVKEQHGMTRGRWREVDHIKPVILGGGLLGVDNLRLLCGACHAKECRNLIKTRKENSHG